MTNMKKIAALALMFAAISQTTIPAGGRSTIGNTATGSTPKDRPTGWVKKKKKPFGERKLTKKQRRDKR